MSHLKLWSISSLVITGALGLALSYKLGNEFKVLEKTSVFEITTLKITPEDPAPPQAKRNTVNAPRPATKLDKVITRPMYPKSALHQKKQGTSEIEVILKKDLSLSLRLSKSSGNDSLDQASLETLKKIPRQQLKKEMKKLGLTHHKVQFQYQMTDTLED